jgi:hypothetical protein
MKMKRKNLAQIVRPRQAAVQAGPRRDQEMAQELVGRVAMAHRRVLQRQKQNPLKAAVPPNRKSALNRLRELMNARLWKDNAHWADLADR